MKAQARVASLLVLVLALAAPSVAAAKPLPKAPAGAPPEITHYTVSVSVNGGPFTEVWRGTDNSAATDLVTGKVVPRQPDLGLAGVTGATDSLAVDTSRQLIIGEGQRTVTYRNTAWSVVQPIYYLDNELTWYWAGSSCYLIGRSYYAYAYPGNGWSCYRLNSSSWGGTGSSPLWSKYQYTYKYNGYSNGIPIIFFKNLGLQVRGYAGGSSSSSAF